MNLYINQTLYGRLNQKGATLSRDSFSGSYINALLKPVQELDTVSIFGRRMIELSRSPKLLEGFTLNRDNPLERIVRASPEITLAREKLEATITIPALLPGINFLVPGKYQMFRFETLLGIVPDLFFSAGKYQPANESYFDVRSSLIESS